MTILCNLFMRIFIVRPCTFSVAMAMLVLTEKFIINLDFTIIQQIIRVKITVENVDKIFLKMTDQSHLVKIVLIMHTE